MKNLRTTGLLYVGTLFLSWLSVTGIWLASGVMRRGLPYYWFVADSNKILAIATAVFLFLFFKNLKLGTNKIINAFAASTFGVLMIHASSDTMRRWLWQDVCGNAQAFSHMYFVLHAFGCTLAVYFVCVLIDMSRKAVCRKILFFLKDSLIQ